MPDLMRRGAQQKPEQQGAGVNRDGTGKNAFAHAGGIARRLPGLSR